MSKSFISPIIPALLETAQDSVDEMRAKVSNVKFAPYTHADKYTKFSFDFSGVSYVGELKGRNVDLCLALDGGAGDKSVALRCLLDGDAAMK